MIFKLIDWKYLLQLSVLFMCTVGFMILCIWTRTLINLSWTNTVACLWTQRSTLLNKLAACQRRGYSSLRVMSIQNNKLSLLVYIALHFSVIMLLHIPTSYDQCTECTLCEKKQAVNRTNIQGRVILQLKYFGDSYFHKTVT